jgi:hypothetical protein
MQYDFLIDQRSDHFAGCKHPVTLCRTRDARIFAPMHFFLPVKRQCVRKFRNAGICEQVRSDVAAWNWSYGLLCGDDMEATLRTGTHFLHMHYLLQCLHDSLKLERDLAPDGNAKIQVLHSGKKDRRSQPAHHNRQMQRAIS